MRHPQSLFPRKDWPTGMIVLVLLAAAALLCILLATHARVEPDNSSASVPGMTLDDLGGASGGLVITSLRTGSEGQRDGITAGDRLISVNHHAVYSLRDVDRTLKGSFSAPIDLQILHNRAERHIVLYTR